ncbi:hypothetical protein [Nonomuraea sp. SBT364]|uniref:hypothetical protein n=1 Tax=Nonomuraea sp. SBT364 TaxID=1580530 RepID=UPI00066A98B3|nr:hypothetical protein [Nonomuraea sp. SBT364]
MATPSHIGPGSWRIVLEATEATLTTSTRKGPRLLFALPRLDGAFYLRPHAGLAGFALQLPLPSRRAEPPVLHWESAELDRDGHAWLRFGRQEVRSPVSVLCAEIPGERPYVKIVLETVFSPSSLRLPAWFLPRPVTLRLFTEIRPEW